VRAVWVALRSERITMAILGVAKAVYGVDDLDKSTQFFTDYGLGLQ
jgi:hypothetical protein